MTERIKQSLAAGKIVRTFALARLVHPQFVDMVGSSGAYDAFWIDCEHAKLTGEQLFGVALAGRANQLDCFARVAPTGYSEVTQCLEVGIGGLMGAQIQDAAHAREFASWCHFAPHGVRGLNTGGRDALYTRVKPADFVANARRQVFVAVQIETTGALEAVEEIAAMETVELLFVGPSDLSLALGVVGQFHHPTLWEAIERIARACRQAGKAWGAVVPDPDFATRAMELGCQMPTVGNDAFMIRRGVDQLQATFASVWPA